MSKPMSAQVCEACHSAPATKVANPLTSNLCVSCRKELGIFVAKLRSIKTPVSKPTEAEYNQYISSLNEAPVASVNDNDSTDSVNEIVEPTTVNTTQKCIKFSSDDELTKRMVNMHTESSTEPENHSSSPASEEESCSSDTNEPVAENNCSEMDASTDAPVTEESVKENTSIEEPPKTTNPVVSDQRKVLQMFHITANNGTYLYDYSLNNVKSKDSLKTGCAFDICTSEYAVIDITFKDSSSMSIWNAVRKDISAINGTRIVATHTGFQLYCKYDQSWDDKHKNRFDREYCCKDYYISIYTPLTGKDCTSNLIAVPFTLIDIGEEEPFKYTFIKECIDESLLSFTDLLKTVLALPHASIVKDNTVNLHCSSDSSDDDFSDDQIDARPVFSSDSSDSDSEDGKSAPIKQTTKPLTKNDMINEILGVNTAVNDDDDSPKAINTSGKVLWYRCANVSNAKDKMLIAHKDITPELIKKGFYEIVGKHIVAGDKVYTQQYIRLFFDFDVITHKDAVALYNKELIPRFDKLKELFGDYSISAYSNKEHIASAIGCKFNATAGKELSLHVVFYESRLLIDDLYALTRTEKFIFPDGWDFSVYNILSRRVFRIHLGPHTGYGIKGINSDGVPVFNPPFQRKKDGELQFNRDDGSPKMSKPDKYCPGIIIGNKPLQTQILQPLGTERVITLEDVLKSNVWFDMKTGITKDDIKVKVNKRILGAFVASDYNAKLVDTNNLNAILEKVKADTVDTDNEASIDYINNVNCLKYLLNCFTPDFVNLQHVFWLVIVCGPYKQETLKEIISEWYWKGEHSTPDGDADYIDCNYITKNREYSDMWFYGAVKHLPAALKDAFIAKYAKQSVNTTVKFDIWDEFGLAEIQKKLINNEYISYGEKTVYNKKARKNALSLGGKYKLTKLKDDDGNVRAIRVKEFPYIKFGDILSDLRRCLAIIDETPMAYIFKDVNGADGKYKTNRTTHASIAKDKLKRIIIKYIASDMTFKSIDLWSMLMANNNSAYITYPAAEFYSCIPDVFSYYYPAFQQCVYDTVDASITDYHKMNNLERWIHHVNNVICNGEEEAIKYIHNWIAKPLQNPLNKNKTALIIKGEQGTGKSWFSEIVARLHGEFGNENIGNMKSICGDFNAIIDNKTLIVVNEMKNVDNSKYYDDDRLKGLITDDKTDIEYKGENAVMHNIYANFIFISNNNTPIKVTDKDRRYVVLKPSTAHATVEGVQDSDYWSPEFYYLKEDREFLAQLYSYYMNLNTKHFNPANIPKTLALAEIIEDSRPRIYDFIIANYDKFVKGWITNRAFDDYLLWCKDNNYQNPGSSRTFSDNLRDYVVWVQKYTHGKNKPPSNVLPQKKYNGKPRNVYKLTDKYVEYFKPVEVELLTSDDEYTENVKDDATSELLE